jgi:uncharacterized protein
MRSVDEWKDVLRAALRDALRTKESHAVAAIRETLAAIENAEAEDLSATPPARAGMIAGGVTGLGAGDVPRRILTAEAVTAILERELRDRQEAVITYEQLGRHDEANVLMLQLEVLASLLSQA